MIVCANGHVNPDGTKFCESCGMVILGSPPLAESSANLTSEELHTQAQSTSNFEGDNSLPPSSSKNPFLKLTDSERPKWLLPVVAVSALVILIGGFLVLNAVTKAKPVAVKVSMTIYGKDNCNIGWGYLDVPGSAVTIEADGLPVGFGTLGRYGDDGFLGCTFDTTIANIPSDASIYSVTVGRRGTITNSQSELKGNDWKFSLKLG